VAAVVAVVSVVAGAAVVVDGGVAGVWQARAVRSPRAAAIAASGRFVLTGTSVRIVLGSGLPPTRELAPKWQMEA
jgi:hypothetical protein